MSNESQDQTQEGVQPENANQQEQANEAPVEEVAETAQASEPGAEDSIETIEDDSVSEVLVEEINALKDQVLRAQAETQNARRRAEQDVEKARKFALNKFVEDLLPVADNLERAITAGDADDEAQKAVLEGVELTLKSLVDTLKKYNVEAINPEGEPFDPELHQAMSMVPNPDVEPNTVMNVFQKGYTLNGRLVRPAMVVVSSAS